MLSLPRYQGAVSFVQIGAFLQVVQPHAHQELFGEGAIFELFLLTFLVSRGLEVFLARGQSIRFDCVEFSLVRRLIRRRPAFDEAIHLALCLNRLFFRNGPGLDKLRSSRCGFTRLLRGVLAALCFKRFVCRSVCSAAHMFVRVHFVVRMNFGSWSYRLLTL